MRPVLRFGSVIVLISSVLASAPTHVGAAELAFSRADFSSGLLALAHLASDGAFSGGAGQVDNVSCTSTGAPYADFALSCDGPLSPEDETPIVADPENPNHLLAGSNDYQLVFKDGTLLARVPTGFFVSFDGGRTWTDGQIPMGSGGGGGNGDPAPAFDAKYDTAHMVQLNAGCGNGGQFFCGNISITISNSIDGGRTWGNPVVIAQGSGSFTPSAAGVFNDKPWLVADNDPSSRFFGRLYVTFTRFVLSKFGLVEAPIYLSTSDDAGRSWTTPKEISGVNGTYCTVMISGAAGACNIDQFSTVVTLPGGGVVVHFKNAQHAAAWETPDEFENQTMAVRSTNGGKTWSAPVHIADLEDAVPEDYPRNADGRGTQTGFQFRTQTVQGMTVDSGTGYLYAFWTDNRDGTRDTGGTAITHTNVFMTKSVDGGVTWTAPSRVTSGPADKWMAWGAAQGGVVKVMYMDASYVYPARDRYGITLATSRNGGSSWSFRRVDSGLSNPNNSLWFRAHVEGCDLCSLFIGDYNGMAIDSLGRTHIVWTDMRRIAVVPALGNRTGAPSEVFYARR